MDVRGPRDISTFLNPATQSVHIYSMIKHVITCVDSYIHRIQTHRINNVGTTHSYWGGEAVAQRMKFGQTVVIRVLRVGTPG